MGAARTYKSLCHRVTGKDGLNYLLPVSETSNPHTFLLSRKKLFEILGMPHVRFKRRSADMLGKLVYLRFDFLRLKEIRSAYTPVNGKLRRVIELYDPTSKNTYLASWDTDKERKGRRDKGYKYL